MPSSGAGQKEKGANGEGESEREELKLTSNGRDGRGKRKGGKFKESSSNKIPNGDNNNKENTINIFEGLWLRLFGKQDIL